MKITLSWLKEHLETEASLDEITDKLTMLGLEVEDVLKRSSGLESFVVGHILEANKHLDADKLQVCLVDNGVEKVEVVCGAPNARKGLKCVYAASGLYVPGIDITLKMAKIRGVLSNGMLLSEREMGLSDEHDGIVELSDDAIVGASVVDVMGLSDPVIDIAITPNRGDCLGVRGIARDLAAFGLGTLKPLDTTPLEGTFNSPIKVYMDLDDEHADACSQFVGRYIQGVKNVESPKWLKDRLLAVGLRPISALVDITNLMTIEYCRPLHVFDADKLHGNIHVRMAKQGEKITGIDGKEYDLDPEITVIADDKFVGSIAGVMGCVISGCTKETVNVFLEAALFNPIRTSTTGRKLNLHSDARFRFERGVDSQFLEPGMHIATGLILDICGGEVSEIISAGVAPDRSPSISFRPSRVKGLAGVAVKEDEMKRILEVLGFGVFDTGREWDVSVPTWRNDIVGEACLVEEIARVFGYDKIPTTPMKRAEVIPHAAWNLDQRRRANVRRSLAACGLVEAVTVSFMADNQARLFGGRVDVLKLANPISADLDTMRPSILPNLITAVGRNADRGLADCSLFEIGPQFAGYDVDSQEMVATGIRSGRSGRRNWAETPRNVDVFDSKADALTALEAAGVPTDSLQTFSEAPDWYHPGRSGTLNLGQKTMLAAFGEIHPGVLAKMGVKGPVAGFEVYLENLPKQKRHKGTTRSLVQFSPFHSVNRDLAFVVDEEVSAGALMRAARSADKALISDVSTFDLFQGGNLGDGRKSIALNITLQPIEKTLTDEEINTVCNKIINVVEKATGGVLRS
jgi:phenylalanyl-tRNA synthetase beta chain